MIKKFKKLLIIIKKQEKQAGCVNPQIQQGICEDPRIRVHQHEQRSPEQKTERGQHGTERRGKKISRINGGLHGRAFAGTEQICGDDRAARIAAESKGQINQRDFIRIAHGGERVVPDEFSGDKAVCDII